MRTKQADKVVYDALVSEDILSLVRPEAETFYAGKRGGKPSWQQKDITDRLIELARDGHRVLRSKGGDPFVFGRGGEEAALVAQNARHFALFRAFLPVLAVWPMPVSRSPIGKSIMR